jgi:hypothetical protein
MPLSRDDATEITRLVERLLRQYDPASYELVMRATERTNDPGRNLLIMLGTLARFYRERSGGENARILDDINHYVRLSDGGPVSGLSVELSSADRELYDIREVDLAVLPDRTRFLEELQNIMGDIERELPPRERERNE